ncbi:MULTISPECIES: 5-oxoprolinase subunit B family protein [Aneurinibacillus]|jgi:urea carboxylase|uniref:Allophanate hydrolase n=1 Tax=Aneurinibacillus danicus TaxID=267746 RepID=A0A511V7K1_9BACL|nr:MULTISPECIES: allophanate hydrolase subunit 1 [Aneurinibacillus]GEN33898.1 allophanate hydrolase [Aneurinibacillus danicus]
MNTMEKLTTRFTFGGDEFIYAEVSRAMNVEANFKVLAVTDEIRRCNIPGVTEICPANASYLIRYNPDIIRPLDLLDVLREIDEQKSDISGLTLQSRVVEIPIWYDDPITKECAAKFKDRHQDPSVSNLEFVMKINGFKDKEDFIHAHSSAPYLVSMVGFVPGTAWEFPLGVPQENIIEAPKYLRPRTQTPARAISMAGAFTVIYPVAGPGGYQLIGMSAVPVYDPEQKLEDLKDTLILAKAGDIWKHRPIDESEYNKIVAEVEAGTYRYNIKSIEFSPEEYFAKTQQYLNELTEGIAYA